MKVNRLEEKNAGEQYELDATKYLNDTYAKDLPGVEFEQMGGADNSNPDIAVKKDGNILFFIECKDLPAQAGEFALRINDNNLTFIPNQNTSEEEGGKDSASDIKCKEEIVNWLNNSEYKDKIISDYSSNGEVNIRLKDPELINLMKNRIKEHYAHMNAIWFCAPSSDDKYSFTLINELDHLMTVDAVTVRNKSNNSKNISVATYDDFNDFAKDNGFTDLVRSKRGKDNIVTFNSKKDLGLKNSKQNLRVIINDKEYVITINTHPEELPGKYMLRNSNRGNIKVLASLGKAKSGVDKEAELINFIKSKLNEELDMRKKLSEELILEPNSGEELKPELEKVAEEHQEEVQKELKDRVEMVEDEINNAETPEIEIKDINNKKVNIKQFTEKLILEEPSEVINEDLETVNEDAYDKLMDVYQNAVNGVAQALRELYVFTKGDTEMCEDAAEEAANGLDYNFKHLLESKKLKEDWENWSHEDYFRRYSAAVSNVFNTLYDFNAECKDYLHEVGEGQYDTAESICEEALVHLKDLEDEFGNISESVLTEKIPSDLAFAYNKAGGYKGLNNADLENASYEEISKEDGYKLYKQDPLSIRLIIDGKLVDFRPNGYASLNHRIEYLPQELAYTNSKGKVIRDTLRMPAKHLFKIASKVYKTNEHTPEGQKNSDLLAKRAENPESPSYRGEIYSRNILDTWYSSSDIRGGNGRRSVYSWELDDAKQGLEKATNRLKGDISNLSDDEIEKLKNDVEYYRNKLYKYKGQEADKAAFKRYISSQNKLREPYEKYKALKNNINDIQYKLERSEERLNDARKNGSPEVVSKRKDLDRYTQQIKELKRKIAYLEMELLDADEDNAAVVAELESKFNELKSSNDWYQSELNALLKRS